jgi:lysophospholipase L1-like esterase
MKKTIILLVIIMLGSVMSLEAQEKDWANLERFQEKNARIEAPGRKENRVVFMGNSITEKWATRDSGFWKGKPYINRGISGQVTSQMLLRFRPDVIELEPEVVVILAGTNDIAQNKGPISVEQIAGNIFSMIELARANNIKVVLCSVLPAVQYKWRKEIKPADKIIALNKLLESYAKKHNVVYVDCYTPMVDENKGLKTEYSPDGVHPNYDGYQLMDPMLEEAIAKTLKKKQPK